MLPRSLLPIQGCRNGHDHGGATSRDTAEDILRTVSAMECIEREHPEISLHSITGEDLRRSLGHSKWLAGVGVGCRVRHLLLASQQAADALALIVNTIEALRRWPAAARLVIANAIPKKAGGVPPHRTGGQPV